MSGGHSHDEADILALLGRMADGWNRADGAAFGAAFTGDADYIVFNGVHLKGRDQIAAVHQALFDTILKGTTLGPKGGEGSGSTIRFLGPDVALIHSSGGVREAGQAEVAPDRNSVQTTVVVKRDGAWLITSFQNTRVQPMGPPSGAPPATRA